MPSYCPQCGAQVPDGAAVCPQCGASLAAVSGDQAQNTAQNPNQQAQSSEPSSQAQPNQQGQQAQQPYNNPNQGYANQGSFQNQGAYQNQGPYQGQPYQNPNYPPYQNYQQPYTDPRDHTGEFDAKDISDNKVFALAAYALGISGDILCLLAAQKSNYAMFHVRESLKMSIVDMILVLCCIVPYVGWVVGGVGLIIVLVLRIIQFVSVCKGQAKETSIISSLKFLK